MIIGAGSNYGKLFAKVDESGDGAVDVKELTHGLRHAGIKNTQLSDTDIEDLFRYAFLIS